MMQRYVKRDRNANTVIISNNGVVHIDGIVVFHLKWENDKMWIVIRDKNKKRSESRGGISFVAVPVDTFIAKLVKVDERKKGRVR